MIDPIRDLARTIAGTDDVTELQEGTLLLRPGLVTALSTTSATVTVDGAPVVCKTYAGQLLKVGDAVDVLFQGSRGRILGATGAPVPKPIYGTTGVSGAAPAAGAFQTLVTNNAAAVLPMACMMIVTWTMTQGFSGADARAYFKITDETGADISAMAKNAVTEMTVDNNAGKMRPIVAVGRKQYAAGATAGFRLQYAISASNIYIDSGYEVRFEPV